MNSVKNLLEEISKIAKDVIDTAQDVNHHSIKRKNITESSLSIIQKIIDENSILRENYEKVYENLNDSFMSLSLNSDELRLNIEYFNEIIVDINKIKEIFNLLDNNIKYLTNLVDEIRNDTDDIFSLALNASIAASKYSHTSGVFDILADKLNEMSIFINQNLENIINVVNPIIDGINNLIKYNDVVLNEINKGLNSFMQFIDILDKQKDSVDDLLHKAYASGAKIDDQKKMIDEINNSVKIMDGNASEAINGSGNVKKIGEDIENIFIQAINSYDMNNNYINEVEIIKERAIRIWNTAQNVNEKSRSQLDFSLNCVSFCDSMVSESVELKRITEIFNKQSYDNNQISNTLSNNLSHLTVQLNMIENKLLDSSNTIKKFNVDYIQMDNILEFLKNILKSMNVIGMLSRIESARDPDEFKSFITISENIRRLQDNIHNNIPLIETNITDTHTVIENVNQSFESMSNTFYTVVNSSDSIILKLEEITHISTESEQVSTSISSESKKIDAFLNDLRSFLIELTEVVKKPIEGSAANIERGHKMEKLCIEITEQTSP